MAEWYSVATPEQTTRLLAAWPDAPIENLELCGFILETAQEQVLAYAPAIPSGYETVDGYLVEVAAVIPDRLVYAQLKQADNLWNAGRVSSSGDVGVEQYSYTPRPLDKTIRGIIRPTDGKPHVL